MIDYQNLYHPEFLMPPIQESKLGKIEYMVAWGKYLRSEVRIKSLKHTGKVSSVPRLDSRKKEVHQSDLANFVEEDGFCPEFTSADMISFGRFIWSDDRTRALKEKYPGVTAWEIRDGVSKYDYYLWLNHRGG